jgi:hypothetical protein
METQQRRAGFISFDVGITDLPAGVDAGKVLGLEAALFAPLSDVDDLDRSG